MIMADEKIGSLEEEAIKRKERLAALKQKNEESKSSDSNKNSLPRPKFRSYKPQDESLKENVLEEPAPGDVESVVQEQLEAAKTKFTVEEVDIGNLAPRKPDWDLKRDVAKKIEKLERRTQKSIAELIIERLKETEDTSSSPTNK